MFWCLSNVRDALSLDTKHGRECWWIMEGKIRMAEVKWKMVRNHGVPSTAKTEANCILFSTGNTKLLHFLQHFPPQQRESDVPEVIWRWDTKEFISLHGFSSIRSIFEYPACNLRYEKREMSHASRRSRRVSFVRLRHWHAKVKIFSPALRELCRIVV